MNTDNSNKSGSDPSIADRAGDLADQARARATDAFDKVKSSSAFKEFRLNSNQLVDKVRETIEEGNARRIVIKKDDKTLLEIPMTVGIGAGAAALFLSPMLAAVGALAALVTDVTVVVERDADEAGGSGSGGGSKDSSGSGKSSGSGSSTSSSGSGSSGSSSGGSSSGGSSSGGSSSSGSSSGGGKTIGGSH